MGRGTRYEVTGLLLRRGRDIVVEVDGGGTWRLDVPAADPDLLGVRVNVAGIRSGFDLLDVESIRREGEQPPPRLWWRRRS